MKTKTKPIVITLIIASVLSLVGIEEYPNNSGFKDPVFEQGVRALNWNTGDAWCVYTTLYAYHQVLKELCPKADSVLLKLASGNSQSFYSNVAHDKSGYFFTCDTAMLGAINIWQTYKNGKPQWSGHAGIVISIDREGYYTVEGNSNTNGSSEGYKIVIHYRHYMYNTTNGLRTKGFINFNQDVL